ncbi:MAG: hypothetical protein Q7S09_04650 [bacterium]|nr:hypothetical protein [bacterium]
MNPFKKFNIELSTLPAAFFILAGIVFFRARGALAEEIYDLTTKNPLPSLSFYSIFCTAANWLVTLGLIVVVIIIGIAGIRFLTSQGDEARRRTAKTTLEAAVIGLLVLLFAKSIIIIFLHFIGLRLTSMTC